MEINRSQVDSAPLSATKMSLKRTSEPFSLVLYDLAIDTVLFVDCVKVAEIWVPSTKAASNQSMVLLTFQQICCVNPILICPC